MCAWRSSGTTNAEMVDKLKRFEVISSPFIEAAFRQVDRVHFVPKNQRSMAHTDQPLREGNLHISAPHIYGTVLEALDLRPNSSLSFLNLGSGTGYLSCIVASILGIHSNNYGVDFHEDVVEHAKAATERWKSTHNRPFPSIEWIHGNALTIDHNKGEAVVGFDRIYVGSSVNKQDLPKLAFLLRPGGILVGPVEDELVKITRNGCRSNPKKNAPNISSSSMETDDADTILPSTEFTQQLLSAVRFATLQAGSDGEMTVLPSTIWNPAIHHQYPDSFRNSCREILLCSHSPKHQPRPKQDEQLKPAVNAAGILPRCLWLEVLSYTHRDWFETPESELDCLRRRLAEEQQAAARAHEARQRAEVRCRQAEEERDVYRILARRYQMRLEAALERASDRNYADDDSDIVSEEDAEDEEEDEIDEGNEDQEADVAIAPLNVRERTVVAFSLGSMFRSVQKGPEESDDEEIAHSDDGDEDIEEAGEAEAIRSDRNNTTTASGDDNIGGMEEDSFPDLDETESMSNTEIEDHRSTLYPRHSTAASGESHDDTVMVVRQPRTVSITCDASL